MQSFVEATCLLTIVFYLLTVVNKYEYCQHVQLLEYLQFLHIISCYCISVSK